MTNFPRSDSRIGSGPSGIIDGSAINGDGYKEYKISWNIWFQVVQRRSAWRSSRSMTTFDHGLAREAHHVHEPFLKEAVQKIHSFPNERCF